MPGLKNLDHKVHIAKLMSLSVVKSGRKETICVLTRGWQMSTNSWNVGEGKSCVWKIREFRWNPTSLGFAGNLSPWDVVWPVIGVVEKQRTTVAVVENTSLQ